MKTKTVGATDYYNALPNWKPWKDGDGNPAAWAELAWSGDGEPPALGERVNINFNGLGDGEVEGYFGEHGFLGVLVKLDRPPAWYTRQNGADAPAYAFGAECAPPTN